MKSIIHQPLKSTALRAALCIVISLATAAQWNPAQGAFIRGGARAGRSGPVRIHSNPAPKPMAREAVRPPQSAPKPVPQVALAPRIAVPRQPIALRNLEFVAHLRRELFSHRWSFVYAANLKHAPKSIRFLQNGTVETDMKGERWYWEALDGRRVSLRTLADASQPGIILDFNEGYTGFQYSLPDQTVAVQGAELNAVAEGPTLSNSTDSRTLTTSTEGRTLTTSTANGPETLEQALLSYQWNWNDVSGKSDPSVRFAKNKSFRVAGRTSFWNVTGPRTVHVEFENGEQTDLLFDTTFSDYTDGNQISGFRVTAESNVATSNSKR